MNGTEAYQRGQADGLHALWRMLFPSDPPPADVTVEGIAAALKAAFDEHFAEGVTEGTTEEREVRSRRAKFEAFVDNLLADGYQPYHQALDAEVARDTSCEHCGGAMVYHGYRCGKDDGASYVALMRCTECGYWDEF